MDYHVLVLAMSTLPFNAVTKPGWQASYRLMKGGRLQGGVYYGLGQLEVIPQLLAKGLGVPITHLIILATNKTLSPICFENAKLGLTDAASNYDSIARLHDGFELNLSDLALIKPSADPTAHELSHVDLFKLRMLWHGIAPQYHIVPVDEYNPAEGLQELQGTIRKLYGKCLEENGDWKLWLDVHGGFREISMAMFGLMQMLAAPDEQDLAAYSSHDEAVFAAIKRLSDQRDTVPISAVYTIEFDPGRRLDEPHPIIDRTTFYSTFTKPAIQAYMNYGQYAQMTLKSNFEDDGEILPYAFVSYRRMDAPEERYAFLGTLKQHGYRYWYDDSIELQEDWAKKLVVANRGCSVLIALVTRNYKDSYQCLKELRQALDDGKLVLLASLDGTPLDAPEGGWHAKDPQTGKEKAVSRDELAALTSRQHIVLENLIADGAFQAPRLVDKLGEFCEKSEAFASIRAVTPMSS